MRFSLAFFPLLALALTLAASSTPSLGAAVALPRRSSSDGIAPFHPHPKHKPGQGRAEHAVRSQDHDASPDGIAPFHPHPKHKPGQGRAEHAVRSQDHDASPDGIAPFHPHPKHKPGQGRAEHAVRSQDHDASPDGIAPFHPHPKHRPGQGRAEHAVRSQDHDASPDGIAPFHPHPKHKPGQGRAEHDAGSLELEDDARARRALANIGVGIGNVKGGDSIQAGGSGGGHQQQQLEGRQDLTPEALVQHLTACKSRISSHLSTLKSLSTSSGFSTAAASSSSVDTSALLPPIREISSELSDTLALLKAYKDAGLTFALNDPALAGADFRGLVSGLLGLVSEVLSVVKGLGIGLLGGALAGLLNEILGLVGKLLLCLNGVVTGLLILLVPVLTTILGLVTALGLSGVLAGIVGQLGLL